MEQGGISGPSGYTFANPANLPVADVRVKLCLPRNGSSIISRPGLDRGRHNESSDSMLNGPAKTQPASFMWG
jgi:hypothetical protein